MLKRLVLWNLCTMFSLCVFAQAYEGKVKYGKTEEPAIVMVYDYPQEVVENALTARLADKGLQAAKNKGFKVYPNSKIDEISRSALDYSFKFVENGKNGAEKTTVYMIMLGSGAINDAASLLGNGKSFLESLAPDVKRSHTVFQIKKQEQILTNEEKTLQNLQKSQQDLEEKLEKNKNKQEAQQKIIASQKAILDDLKTKQD